MPLPYISYNIYELWYGMSKRNQELKTTASFQLDTKMSYWIDRQAESFRRVTQRWGHGGQKSLKCLWKEQVETVWWTSGTDRHPQIYSMSLMQTEEPSFNFSPVAATVKDVICSKNYRAPSGPWKFFLSSRGLTACYWPLTAGSKDLARLYLSAATYKHSNLLFLILSPS